MVYTSKWIMDAMISGGDVPEIGTPEPVLDTSAYGDDALFPYFDVTRYGEQVLM